MNNFEEILDYIVKNESSKTVGLICKRIEISLEKAKKENRDYITFEELDMLKIQQKEIIYEQYRNLRDFLKTGKILFTFQGKEKSKGE